MSFIITCPDISRHIDEFKEKEPEAKFIIEDHTYHFKAKVLGITEKQDAIHESLDFKVVSPIKGIPLRSNFRIKLLLKVRIHEYVDDFKKLYSNGWICDAVSEDISKDGIRLWSDYALGERKGDIFTLEFSLKDKTMYMIPIILKRSGPNTATRSYKYDYGFLFDFNNMPGRQEKLILDILEYKMKNRL
jgi:hypothetical protein